MIPEIDENNQKFVIKVTHFSYLALAEKINKIKEFTDSRDGKIYKTVQVGNQTWMAGNFAYLPEVNPPDVSSLIYHLLMFVDIKEPVLVRQKQ